MGFLYLGIILFIIGILGCEIFYKYKISSISPFIAGIGFAIVCWMLLILIVEHHSTKSKIIQYNFNPCSMYHINDEIAQNRAFENDFLYGFAYSHDIANLPYVECGDNGLIRKIPRDISKEQQ